MTDKELLQQALHYMDDNCGAYTDDYRKLIEAIRARLSQCDRCGEVNPAEIHTCSPQEPVLQDIEQYRLQMAAISTAAIGYWKEGDGILPDYDTPALRDVAKLYSKYEALYATPPQREWQGLTDEDWIIGKRSADYIAGAEWAEAKLKEKNG